MTKREVLRTALRGAPPPYVPWSCGFTVEAWEKLTAHFGGDDLECRLGNHMVELGSGIGYFEPVGNDRYRDIFGVIWNRSVDKDIGIVEEYPLREARITGLTLPDPDDPRFTAEISARIARFPNRFRVYSIGFSLYERAWTLRGIENLLTDFLDHPRFVRDLLRAIADFNIALIQRAAAYDIDAIHFGDDWGQQHGLQMGYPIWREFLYPELQRMYGAVREAGLTVSIHSCGAVDELFEDLIALGVQCFNPFQPEVMDVWSLLPRYRGRLAFHGGLSTQKTLPFGTPDEVREETQRLLALGRKGGYIFAPAHAVEGDVPLDNMLAFLDELWNQPGLREGKYV